jgi:prepilin-type N-terminal cleavage/methylation domain-containing protein
MDICPRNPVRAIGGFTLIEILVTILLVGVLLAGIMLPMQTQVDTRKVEETRFILEKARDALLNYAAQYGRFPCPANAANGGVEPGSAVPATGFCFEYLGFLPARTVGFTPLDRNGYALDPWGGDANRIRYAVASDTVGGIATPFTRTGGMAAAGAASITSAVLLHVCGSGVGVNPGTDCGATQTLARNAVFVVWSTGPNGASGGTSVHERENPSQQGGIADRIFVHRTRSDTAGAEFDDIVLWVSSLTVVNRLVTAGVMP